MAVESALDILSSLVAEASGKEVKREWDVGALALTESLLNADFPLDYVNEIFTAIQMIVERGFGDWKPVRVLRAGAKEVEVREDLDTWLPKTVAIVKSLPVNEENQGKSRVILIRSGEMVLLSACIGLMDYKVPNVCAHGVAKLGAGKARIIAADVASQSKTLQRAFIYTFNIIFNNEKIDPWLFDYKYDVVRNGGNAVDLADGVALFTPRTHHIMALYTVVNSYNIYARANSRCISGYVNKIIATVERILRKKD